MMKAHAAGRHIQYKSCKNVKNFEEMQRSRAKAERLVMVKAKLLDNGSMVVRSMTAKETSNKLSLQKSFDARQPLHSGL